MLGFQKWLNGNQGYLWILNREGGTGVIYILIWGRMGVNRLIFFMLNYAGKN